LIEHPSRPLFSIIVACTLMLLSIASAGWAIWATSRSTNRNAEVLCNVLTIGRQARIERLAVTPGTADELQAELRRINDLYDRISEPIPDCDVRHTVVRR
jgi:hypothetical protein